MSARMFPVEAIPWPFSPPMPTAKSILFITVEFTLDRVDFVALNGGPQFKFTEAISFSVNCGTQDEIDYFWEKLSADGGSTGRCGWLKDKFGLSWQINPVFLGDMLSHRDA